MARYRVIVGNVGQTHNGGNKREAVKAYRKYVELSRDGYGRVAGEPVTLFDDEEIIMEYFGKPGETID